MGSCGRAVERRTVNRGDVVQSHLPPFRNLGNFVHPYICLCLSEETLKAGGPFYLVSMPGEVKDHTQGVNVKPVVDSLILEDNSCVSPSLGCLEETT